LYKKELINWEGPWEDAGHVTVGTAEWVYWYNNERLHSACGNIPPAEYEKAWLICKAHTIIIPEAKASEPPTKPGRFRSRCAGLPSAMRPRSPPGAARPGRRYEASGGAGAWICFGDESGQALQPPVARTWGRRGHTPVVRVTGRGSGRISVAALACVKAGQPGRFSCRMRGHQLRPRTRRAMSEADYAALITAAHRYLDAPVIVIWDNLPTHLSRKMTAFTTGHPDWLTVIQLPAYAPDLNPVESAWSVMKNGLGNLAPGTTDQLAGAMRNQLDRIQRRHGLITGFLGQTGLTLEIKPPDTQTLAFQAL
jgi:transposase